MITTDSQVHSFTSDGKTDPDGFFSISGNTSTSKGSVSFNNETLTTCLKLESATKISFNAKENGTLVLVFGGSTNASGKKVKVNGTAYEIPTSQILELALSSGSHSITKGDSINLFFMAFVPASSGAHTHKYESETTYEATCTDAGLLTYVCECGDSYTETIDPTGHIYNSETIGATCTESGLCVYTCACGDSYTEESVPLGHSYDCEITEATCTEAGLRTYTCACGDSYVEAIEPIGHKYDCEMTPATCTEIGYYTYTCKCGDSYQETIDALGHSHKLKTATNPTCTKAGLMSYACICGDIYIEEVAPLGHSYVDGICQSCGESEPADTPIEPDNPDENDKEDVPNEDGKDDIPGEGDSEDNDSTIDDDNKSDESDNELSFFEKIWKAIVDFFQRLFGIKKD